MGFYFGMYAFSANKIFNFIINNTFFLHGFYNFFGYPINIMIVMGMLTLAIILHSLKHRYQENEQKN